MGLEAKRVARTRVPGPRLFQGELSDNDSQTGGAASIRVGRPRLPFCFKEQNNLTAEITERQNCNQKQILRFAQNDT